MRDVHRCDVMATSKDTIHLHLIIVNILANVIFAQQHEDYSQCCSIKVGKQQYDCTSVTETKYCEPSVADSTVVGNNTMTYLRQSFNYSTNSANVSWSQHIAETVTIQGYVVQLKEFSLIKPEAEKIAVCYLVTFAKSVLKGNQVLNVDCLPMPNFTDSMLVSVTVFAVAESSNTSITPPTNGLKEKPYESKLDYNLGFMYHTQQMVLRVNFTPNNMYLSSLQLCNQTLNKSKRLWCHDVFHAETELQIAQSPLNDTYLQMLPMKCSSNPNCNRPRVKTVNVDFSRKENFEITCIREDYRTWDALVEVMSLSQGISIQVTPTYQFNELTCALEKFECDLYMVMGLHTCENIDDVLKVKRISSTYLYHKSLSVIFDELPAGNYCARIKPMDPLCPKNGCLPRSCKVREVLGQVDPEDPVDPGKWGPGPVDKGTPLTVGAWIGIVVAVVLGVSLLCMLRFCRRNKKPRK